MLTGCPGAPKNLCSIVLVCNERDTLKVIDLRQSELENDEEQKVFSGGWLISGNLEWNYVICYTVLDTPQHSLQGQPSRARFPARYDSTII